MNTTQNTADQVMAEIADPLDALLRQIVNGYFVLTDGQGSVSKWSGPAELLFMQPSEDILGKGFFETLIGGTLPQIAALHARLAVLSNNRQARAGARESGRSRRGLRPCRRARHARRARAARER